MLLDQVYRQWGNWTVMKVKKKEWLCLDSLTDIPPDCLVDSLDDAGSGIVLLYFLEVERWGCLEITKTIIIVSQSWKQWKHTLTPHSRLHRAPKTWNIWTLFSNKAYLENVVGYFDTVTFYKYLAVMSIQKNTFLRGNDFLMCQCCRCFETGSTF